MSNRENRGKGYALMKSFEIARGEIIVAIDSGGSHDPKEIPALVKQLLNDSDMVSGSRFLSKSKHFTSRINRIGNLLFHTVVMILTRKRITDSQTGFRAFKKNFVESLALEACGFEIETEITVKGLTKGFHVKEIPISCRSRLHNKSKLRIAQDGIKILGTILDANSRTIAR